MSVTNTTTQVVYTTNGFSSQYSFSSIDRTNLQSSDFSVYLINQAENKLVDGLDYTLNMTFGLCNFGSAPESGQTLVIERSVVQSQPENFRNSGPLTLANIEKSMDRLTFQAQEINNTYNRALLLSRGSGLSNIKLPDAEADKVLGWNSGATALENKTPTYSEAPLASQAEAEAGTNNAKVMTPLRAKQAFDYNFHRRQLSYSANSTGFTASADKEVYFLDSNGGAFTVDLPAASGLAGKRFVFKKVNTDFNKITIDPNGSETIDGATTYILNTPNESVVLVCDGTSWYTAGGNRNNYLGQITTTLSWTTNRTETIYYSRMGSFLRITGKISATGTPAGGSLTLSLPNSWTMIAALSDASGGIPVGIAKLKDGAANYMGAVFIANTSQLAFRYFTDNTQVEATTLSTTAPVTIVSGDQVTFDCFVPIEGWQG